MDITPIAARLSVIANCVNALRELAKLTFDEFTQDAIARSATERYFQVVIQAALDIGSAILAEQSVEVPGTYRDIFLRLSDIGVIPSDFSRKMASMAQFRNVLVHMYVEVDPQRVYSYLQNNLDDLEVFARYISQYLQQ